MSTTPSERSNREYTTPPRLTEAELDALAQKQRASSTLKHLRQAQADAEHLRALNSALTGLVDELQDERGRLIAEHRLSAIALAAVGAVCGYLLGMVHAGWVS